MILFRLEPVGRLVTWFPFKLAKGLRFDPVWIEVELIWRGGAKKLELVDAFGCCNVVWVTSCGGCWNVFVCEEFNALI